MITKDYSSSTHDSCILLGCCSSKSCTNSFICKGECSAWQRLQLIFIRTSPLRRIEVIVDLWGVFFSFNWLNLLSLSQEVKAGWRKSCVLGKLVLSQALSTSTSLFGPGPCWLHLFTHLRYSVGNKLAWEDRWHKNPLQFSASPGCLHLHQCYSTHLVKDEGVHRCDFRCPQIYFVVHWWQGKGTHCRLWCENNPLHSVFGYCYGALLACLFWAC